MEYQKFINLFDSSQIKFDNDDDDDDDSQIKIFK